MRAPRRPEPGSHRPKFWRWARLNELDLRPLADKLGVSHQTLFFVMLPWGDPRRPKVVRPDLALAIEALTGGEVRADRDWTPPEAAAAPQDGGAG